MLPTEAHGMNPTWLEQSRKRGGSAPGRFGTGEVGFFPFKFSIDDHGPIEHHPETKQIARISDKSTITPGRTAALGQHLVISREFVGQMSGFFSNYCRGGLGGGQLICLIHLASEPPGLFLSSFRARNALTHHAQWRLQEVVFRACCTGDLGAPRWCCHRWNALRGPRRQILSPTGDK